MASDLELKRLDFVRSFATTSMNYAGGVYVYAKSKSGPLQSSVEAVETTLVQYSTPLVEKYGGYIPSLLALVDTKVDSAIKAVEGSYPVTASKAIIDTQSEKAKAVIQAKDAFLAKTEDAIKNIRETVARHVETGKALPSYYHEVVKTHVETLSKSIKDAREAGIGPTFESAVNTVQKTAAQAWTSLSKIPVVSATVEKLSPSVIAAADRYNELLKSLKVADDKRVSNLASWLPYLELKHEVVAESETTPETAE